MPGTNDATDPVASYILNYLASLNTLERAKAKLAKMVENLALPESERAAAGAAFLDVSDQMGQLKSAHTAFMASHQPGINPPSAEAVQRSLDLSTQLATVISKAKTAVAILNAVIGFVDAWSKLSAPAAAAPMVLALSTSDWLTGHGVA